MAFNGRFILNLIYFAQKLGVNKAEILQTIPFTENELCDEKCVVNNETYNHSIKQVTNLSQDPFFGLHAGENLNLAAAGLIGQITHSCQTIKQALEYCCEFANLGCSALPMKLEKSENEYKLIITPDPQWSYNNFEPLKQTVEGTLAFTIKEFQSLTRNLSKPIKIHIPWFTPHEEYERVFQTPIHKKDEIAIFFSKEQVEEKVISSNYDLLRILVSHAQEKKQQFLTQTGFKNLVKSSMVNLIKPQFPTLEQVAAHLNISARTLQRKLKEENCSYKFILDELRKDFALSYIKDKKLNISDIAFLLNYSEISSFSRSFKRWTGLSPQNYLIK